MSKNLLFLAMFLLIILSSCSNSEYDGDVLELEYTSSNNVIDDPLKEGIANFAIDNHNTKVFEKAELLLINNSVNAISYHWDFGNGDTSTEAIPNYAYEWHGIFTITLIITDLNGDTKEVRHDITVLCVFDGEDHDTF